MKGLLLRAASSAILLAAISASTVFAQKSGGSAGKKGAVSASLQFMDEKYARVLSKVEVKRGEPFYAVLTLTPQGSNAISPMVKTGVLGSLTLKNFTDKIFLLNLDVRAVETVPAAAPKGVVDGQSDTGFNSVVKIRLKGSGNIGEGQKKSSPVGLSVSGRHGTPDSKVEDFGFVVGAKGTLTLKG